MSARRGARYYFEHLETARFLLEYGMNPNHMNWRRITLLHDKAIVGDTQRGSSVWQFESAVEAIITGDLAISSDCSATTQS